MAGSPWTRTLVVVRHAKAERQGATDFDRVLAGRGLADATAAGEWLAGVGVSPGLALVSAARRTEQTWELLARAAGWALEPDLTRALYLADEEVVLERLRATDDDVTCVVVVGHNPTMHALAVWLDDGEGDEASRSEISSRYPTSAVCVLEVPGPWSALAGSSATVRGFHVGRG